MENLGKVTLFALMIISAFLVSMLGVKIILSIANLYHVDFITQYSFIQIYGALVIINMIDSGRKEEKKLNKETGFVKDLENTFIYLISRSINYLMFWGFSFLMYYILT